MRSSRPRPLSFLGALVAPLLVATLLPPPARASEEDAKTLFAAGRELRKSGDCAEAIRRFRRALDVFPEGLGALRNIAECEVELGRLASARRSYWDLRRAVLLSKETKYEGWAEDAEKAYAELAQRVPKLSVTLRGKDLDRVRVALDGRPLDPRLIGVELERDIGPHTVEAFYGGAVPVTRQVTLKEGARVEIVVPIPSPALATSAREPAEPPGPPSPPLLPPRPEPLPDRPPAPPVMRTIGFVLLGAGSASALGALVSLGVRQSALAEIEEGCPAYAERAPCPRALMSAEDRGELASTLVNVFGAAAFVGLGGGAALVLASPGRARAAPPERPKKASSGSPRVTLRLSPTSASARLSF